ncbi:dynamin family protein, partial [Mariniblastus sp.]|nr:dynamin family protein [Mariniblastus sp.]
MNDNPPEKTDSFRCDQIREKISINRQLLQTSEVNAAVGEFPECADAQRQLADTLNAIERKLEDIPPIDIAVLGPSRHGKSTLLNSLAAQDLLPTSDVKPCTASILKMTWSEDWSVRIKFVELEQLKRDWGEAVKDARIEMEERQNAGSENNADPSFIRNTLRRFLTLFKIDDQLPPQEMIEAVRNGKLTGRIVKSIKDGELVLPAADIETMKALIQKYLSTDDVYWTIVAQCEILGPFDNWHPSLTLVDLPGTNDTDPQRTAVTNSVREKCTAVAIVTSDSNLGPDIEAWLRHSSVLSNFLEATKKRRQRLFIVRTKVDSYHPEIDDDVDDISEEEEARQYAAAIEKYKKEQTDSYHTMLQDIAGPKLPNGDDEDARAKRVELLSRISEIPVYYVSALAHEVFSGRHRAGKRTRRQLSEYFDDDIQKTGIPQLRDSFVEIAKEYLAENFYDDLEDELESEARHMAAVFRSCSSILKAEIADGRKALTTVVTNVKSELLPWWKSEVSTIGRQFGDQLQFGSDGIMTKLKYASEMSKRRFGDKIQLWSNYHWASLRAATRKNGSHITSRGQSIDFAEDICTVLVDDVLLAWSQFRDDVIENQVSEITNDLVAELNERLENFKTLTEVP